MNFRTHIPQPLPLAVALIASLSVSAVLVEEELAPRTLTASSTFSPRQAAGQLVNGAGLTDDRHDNDGGANTMWHSLADPPPNSPAAGLPAVPAWVRFDFAAPMAFDEIRIWNHNQANYTDRGFRRARLFASTDGLAWTSQTIEIPRANGAADEPVSLAVKTDGRPVRSVIIAAQSNYGSAYYGLSEVRFVAHRDVAEKELPFPASMECKAQPYYGHRADGQAGRALTLNFAGGKLFGNAAIEVGAETTRFENLPGKRQLKVLLSPGLGFTNECEVRIAVRQGQRSLERSVRVPRSRQWTVYLLPHSHVDIGYTTTQDNVEFIHRQNILEAIQLAKTTANYPAGARFRWDTEVAWPAERLLANGTQEEKRALIDAVRQGIIHVGASYINDNTSVSADEEFAAFFGPSKRIDQLTGVKSDTIMQVDIPGMSWGVVPAAARHGIPYVLLFNNGGDRVGLSMELSHRPFWWVGPDGKSKVLCLQPGSYAPCAQIKGKFYWPQRMGQTDRAKLAGVVKSATPRANFIDAYLWKSLAELEQDPLYPYDIFPMSWALADNMPLDADVPEAVKSWNEEYAFPRVVIATSHDIMAAFDKKYGDRIPTRTGEFTEYWSDGLGSAAKQTSMNRHAKERLIQADTLWAMLRPGQPAPRADFDEAWRNVLLGSEHTWCYSQPQQQPITDNILKVKFSYFQEAHDRSQALLAAALKTATQPASETVTVFNTLSWSRSGLVTLPGNIATLEDASGKPVPTQKLSSGETVFLAQDVPALGSRSFSSSPVTPPIKSTLRSTPTTLDNGLVRVTLDPQTGDIVSLVRDGTEFVDTRAPCRLNSYRYLRGAGAPTKAVGPTEVKISIQESGPVLAALRVDSQAEGCKSLAREVRLLAGQPQVEIVNTLDKLAITAKEGVHFGFAFDIPDPRTRMDIPWGVVEVDADFFPEANRNWICFQRWLDISNRERGVTWCSPDAPTFEHGDITANILGGASGSSAWLRKLQPSATLYSWALNNHWHTNFRLSQDGFLTFRYSILAHRTGFAAAAANRFGMEQARPLVAVSGKTAALPPLSLDHPRVVVSSLKSLPEGLLVTLRSLSDKPETANLAFPAGAKFAAALPSNLLGEKRGEPSPVQDGKLTVPLDPYAPASFILK
jgi:alpha-mannosidase